VSEAELITRARRGDEAAWEALVIQYQEPAFRLAYLLLGDAAEAQDVTQDAFIRAFYALDRFDTARPLRPWLFRIVTNLVRNRQRAIGRYLEALRRLVWTTPEEAPDAEAENLHRWETQALWQAVRRLNQADREIIYTRYFLELSESEVASVLNIAPGTVKSRLHRALKRLRAIMQ
jgi:RNA polymerase sigma-70 factor, ECF subfamily